MPESIGIRPAPRLSSVGKIGGCLDGCFCSDAHCRNVATEGGRPTVRARLVRFAGIAVILVVLFAGLYFAIVSFE